MEESAHCTSNLNWEGPATRTELDDQEDDQDINGRAEIPFVGKIVQEGVTRRGQ